MLDFEKGSFYQLIKDDLNTLSVNYSTECTYDNLESLTKIRKREFASGNLPLYKPFMVLEIKNLFSFACDLSTLQIKILLDNKIVYLHLIPEQITRIQKII